MHLQFAEIQSNGAFDAGTIVAGARNPMPVFEAALIDAGITSLACKVLNKPAGHPLTDSGLPSFLNDL